MIRANMEVSGMRSPFRVKQSDINRLGAGMAWKKGESGNPKGRPRSGNSLAEAIRRLVDPDDVAKELWAIAQTSPSDQTRLRAMEIVLGFGYKKPAQVLEVGPADPFEDMSEDELRALIAEDDAQLAQLEEVASEGGPALSTSVRGVLGEAASPSPELGPADSRTTSAQAGARVGVHVRKRLPEQDG